ncbi:16S rRNA (uracil(1498)-N(3))-methyltransferase [Bacillus aquiflavi]|uniref:Ribosomal RNA small subunit methyltransferase E n=1 Tax=Bacillus aquiflavi TaxID=2672567 RepID=A0A6B3VV88_9BACI|nr:16S rRNA (uracil(1498)-N(3))-methyltransferase [Bacillus aquiflavi]MBA4535882.1 16S rRNA (uracil(1498)-N(3))-methyltransferase [Bacillus aquiflavi]NEY80257.1 16S rRNA (uracil(1498)-N(3))-methyltransferase [Bacillus aquiflavi]UAC50064.1 16S rRNA (uracil(1498)-N(3))-methyltransferase [Bacillus aquiflavi]
MQRYFNTEIKENSFYISGDDFHHISKVMRMKIGDHIICVTNDGRSAICSITKIADDYVAADVVQWESSSKELPIQMTIASGLPKGDKLEWIIQKGTELGAYEFIPFIATRSIVKWDEKKSLKKLERWKKIAKEAAEQSQRNRLPLVHTPISLETLLNNSQKYDRKLIAYEEAAKHGETSTFVQVLEEIKKGESLLIVFGPEGGLTPNEVQLLIENGFYSCGLGPRILRTETAPLYALAAASYHLELLR